MKGFLGGRTSVILGSGRARGAFEQSKKVGGGFAPNLFGGVPRPRGPAQTPQLTDSRPPNKSFILSPRPERSHVKAVWPEIIGSVFGQVPPWSPKLSGPTAGGSSCSAGCAKKQPGRLLGIVMGGGYEWSAGLISGATGTEGRASSFKRGFWVNFGRKSVENRPELSRPDCLQVARRERCNPFLIPLLPPPCSSGGLPSGTQINRFAYLRSILNFQFKFLPDHAVATKWPYNWSPGLILGESCTIFRP
jgi:hypothetical protein